MSPLMRRRPVLRAAAVGGGAYVAGKRRAENQAREAEQEERLAGLEQQGPAPAAVTPAAGLSADAVDRLKELGQLHEQGVLTDDEFARQKTLLLGG